MERALAVDVRAVRKGYREGDREHVVLDGVHASVAVGERVAVLGPSGSGKSTLLNLIGGIDRPDAGTIQVGGVDLTSLPERDRTAFRREHLGFIFQFFNLLPTLTVLENLLLPLELNGVSGPRETERAHALLDAVGLADRAGAYPDRLSGGEQQRVAVARAIVHRPRLVLADEPTGNLDEGTGETVVTLLDELVERDGLSLVVVTHSRELAGHMDRMLRVSQGRVIPDAS